MTFRIIFITLCVISLWISTSQSQKPLDFNVMLDMIFDGATNTLDEESSQVKVCGIGKECVPRMLCKADGSVKTFAEDMVDLRMDTDSPCAYLEKCCRVQEKLTEPPPEVVPNVQGNGCGYHNMNGLFFKITGGQEGEAEFGEFPWTVALFKMEGTAHIYRCGGSLIAPNVILTAAHCVSNQQAGTLKVRAGEWDTQTDQEPLPHQDANIKEIIIHEEYNPSTVFNDIALLILETSFTWAANIQPVCLPDTSANFDNTRCFVAGWGKDKYGKDGFYQLILKKVELPVVAHDTCQDNLRRTRLSRFFQLDQSFMCAGGEKDKDTCKGDGGSPLVCPDPRYPGKFFQAGIVSWGVRCGEANIPGVYANVPYLRRWIDGKLAERGIDSKHFTA